MTPGPFWRSGTTWEDDPLECELILISTSPAGDQVKGHVKKWIILNAKNTATHHLIANESQKMLEAKINLTNKTKTFF